MRYASAILLLSVASATPALAATDGTLGPTSTGSVTITASIPQQVRISGLTDVTFSSVDPASNASRPQNVCVWSNTLNGAYNIKATGSGTASAFTIKDASNQEVSYSVEWNQVSGATTGDELTSGLAKTGLRSSATTSDCSSGGTSASLIIGLTSAQLSAMKGGVNYTGSLTLLVAPE